MSISRQPSTSFEIPTADLAVLGIEGFFRQRSTPQATLELARDYGSIPAETWDEFRHLANVRTLAFLSELQPPCSSVSHEWDL